MIFGFNALSVLAAAAWSLTGLAAGGAPSLLRGIIGPIAADSFRSDIVLTSFGAPNIRQAHYDAPFVDLEANNRQHLGELATAERDRDVVSACSKDQDRLNADQGAKDANIAVYTPDADLRRRLRADTRPICITVGQINLRIPRNFLSGRSSWVGGAHDSIIIEVTYPDFQPFTLATSACFEQITSCPKQRLMITGSIPSSDFILDNGMGIRDKSPIHTADGYDRYDIGPPEYRHEYFTKFTADGRLVFSCFPPQYSARDPGSCTRFMPFLKGTGIFYRFSYDNISEAEMRDRRIYNLVHSFVISGG